MRIKCPHGWQGITQAGNPKLGRITVHHTSVEIYDGICNSPDLCKISTCQYYDTSREATRRFNSAVAYYTWTEEGILETRRDPTCHLCPREEENDLFIN